jgi:hypothetical protein
MSMSLDYTQTMPRVGTECVASFPSLIGLDRVKRCTPCRTRAMQALSPRQQQWVLNTFFGHALGERVKERNAE